ncbi:serine/threonine-protein kinase CBK1-like [Amphibalanus amphitrite]|uniref:serine/threonine-protein kinase CBK1-like n=1 Tax=Amphibalanus amphitrite TaxID=1232801 RepID=UPI001C9052E9|nr:serine/threonine-protein kinase CBK1-like [Amphibalanus amphitrite]
MTDFPQASKLATLAPTVQSENSPGATLSSNQEDFYSDYDQSPAPTQNPMIVMDMNASQQQQQHHQQQQHEQQQQQQQQFMQMSEESSKRKREVSLEQKALR